MSNKLIITATLLTTLSLTVSASSIDNAKMLNEHGLQNEAKKELIDIIFTAKSKENQKAQAYYLLGNIAFSENKITTALDTWVELKNKYPKSNEAKLVVDKISQLSEIVGESAKESVNNAVASSYLKHADFWSKGKDSRFTIDSSWMGGFDAALKWYDKTITEFPNTTASRVAYQDKIRTLIGWKDSGQYGSSYGTRADFDKYITPLTESFIAFEKEHPSAATLQAFRYQIAQVYWSAKDWPNTKLWLNNIVKIAGDNDTFYKDAAKRRLAKVEY
ncbi:tol-pal system YbgF family protein [Colwellia sp. BRX8-9]|uniref:tetratricopeptide repeat protein n=1 Tax=Colwellia sp. BRX8-9 TaxID=2759831 RepID=UPI0015F51A0A|nr:hypothetical protein [Colwellia sp. BRX8-9]MBA6348311.1 hypothetical protein [Colwellia sp. BRX8-9]